ncbi:hypothetical protein Bbelb_318690 [Branchiostoma belcheri]|nr:hypothetical protein Bbelb_318690 [Branchiostoma belcheri]
MGCLGPQKRLTCGTLTQEDAARYVTNRQDSKGHRHLPVMNIPWEKVIIDTMHMYLRIGGKLLTQLIGGAIDQDATEKLQQAMRDIGIGTFYIRKEATQQGPSTFKWKTLSAKELKKAVKMLPDKMPQIIQNIGIASEVKIDSLQGRQLTSILNSKGARVPKLISERKAILKTLLGGAEMISEKKEIKVLFVLKSTRREFVRARRNQDAFRALKTVVQSNPGKRLTRLETLKLAIGKIKALQKQLHNDEQPALEHRAETDNGM